MAPRKVKLALCKCMNGSFNIRTRQDYRTRRKARCPIRIGRHVSPGRWVCVRVRVHHGLWPMNDAPCGGSGRYARHAVP
eukprot:6140039-Prymnesium_polylepis.1